jgi:transglutaminase-like putative cysteine protease
MGRLGIYLKPTQTIDSDHESIQEIAKALSRNRAGWVEKATRLFYFVRDSIPYNLFMISMYAEDFKANCILEWKQGYCVQKAVLLAALARAMGIPARLAFARIRNHRTPAELREKLGTNIFPRHCYNQLYLEGRWINLAATFDQGLCQRHELPTVEFNGTDDALLPPLDFNENSYIEYLRLYGSRADLPLKWITRETSKVWGTEKRPWLGEDDYKGW